MREHTFDPKWRCKSCGCYFEVRQAHGCCEQEIYIRLKTKKEKKNGKV